MDKKITWLRIAYWTTAIADFVVAILVLIPSRMAVLNYVYPMGLMSAVAFSWGVALLIADKKPVDRRWFIIPTILVVALLGVVGLHSGIIGLIPFIRGVLTFIVAVILLSLLIYSYIISRDLK
jgi:VIT1/CCC1 family predicted Fe2+/Mn2+ transporter